ncbi:hypothetical protein AB1K83_01905 [Sporosarcina sp. 179-K 3D1 HS]|uniref:hypothetical protein n=1 Tax=Sporosarcina sp. 179-K 3D1 HS TaxID=3232169 RepID=UPI0039A16BFD
MKFIVRTVVILLIVDALLVYMHYSQKEGNDAEATGIREVIQEIELVNRPDGLHIRHHFSNLSENRHEIIWPEKSVSRSCHLETVSSCDRLDENLTGFSEGEVPAQSISYVIPREREMKETALFRNTFAALRGGVVSTTRFHLTDETASGGLWINGLKRIGHKKMEYIDYSYYRGAGKVTDLYWQKEEPLLAYKGNRLSVYGQDGAEVDFESADLALEEVGANHSTVVLGKVGQVVRSDRFIITPNQTISRAADLFLASSIHSQYQLPATGPALAEVLASILSGKPTGSAEARAMYQTLRETVTEEELAALRITLHKRSGEKMSGALLDDLIGEVTGFGTSYFEKSLKDGSANRPFLVEDLREIALNGETIPDLHVLLKDGNVLYPSKTVLRKLGYTIESNERSIYIKSGKHNFRFPKKDPFYVYNERKYTLRSIPFELLEGEIYFQEDAFRRLFLLSIEKKEEMIDIVPIASQLEEVQSK